MNIKAALAYGRSQLTHSPSPLVDARLLLAHLLDVPLGYLVSHDDRTLTRVEEKAYHKLLDRAGQQEPIPYITGRAPFFDFDLIVDPAVLIPRPETEQLVEAAAAWALETGAETAVDVGTGSGCVAIALARRLPHLQVTAVDISTAALTLARQNAARLAPDRIQFRHSDLLEEVVEPVDLIVANLPYVTSGEWQALADGVKLYEPALALDGGVDGLDLIRRLLQQATTRLRAHSAIFLEIGWQQGKPAQQLAQEVFPEAAVAVLPDYAGHDRIVKIVTGIDVSQVFG